MNRRAADAGPGGGELRRLREIGGLLSRHGWRGLAVRLGLARGAAGDAPPTRPESLVALLTDLGPVAVKLGQILATRNDLLGPEWTAALARLHDRVEPLPYEQMEPRLRAALGASPEEVFATFEREPIAAASIAQVYGATLRSGEPVIVKVRRPGAARMIDADLRLLRRLARLAERRVPELARLRPDELLRHFSESLAREIDLSAEARSAEEIGAFLATLGVATPAIHWEFTSRLVNVQQRLEGAPASRAFAAPGPHAGADLLAREYAQAVLRMIIFNGQFHADPHPGNVWLLPDGGLGFIDFGAVGTLHPARRTEVVRLALGIAADDFAATADLVLAWAGGPDVDRDALERDLRDLISRFKGALLSDIELADIFNQVQALLRSYRLALPPDLALMLRTLLTAEGFVRGLAPDFDIASELAPIAKALVAEQASPEKLLAAGRRAVGAFAGLVASTPELVGHLERAARRGKISVELDPAGARRLSDALDRAAARLALVLAGGAGVLASAVLAAQRPGAALAALVAGLLLWAAAWRRR